MRLIAKHTCRDCKKENKHYNGLVVCDDCWLENFRRYGKNKRLKIFKLMKEVESG